MLHLRSHELLRDQIQNNLNNHPHHNISRIFKTDAIIISGCFILIGICIVIVYLCYRKYRTRHLYNQSPQALSKKPSHNIKNIINLAKANFEVIQPEKSNCISVISKQLYQGRVYQISFFDGVGGVYLDHKLKHNCYFQIEVLQQNSLINMGYVHADDLQKLKQGQDLIRTGISICNYGTIMNAGHRQFSYQFTLKYGDTIGMGITHDKGSNQRRVWVSHNGKLLNPPTSQQIDSWISKQSFDQSQKKQYQNKKNIEDQDYIFQQQLTKKNPQYTKSNMLTDRNLAKKKITLNSAKKFEYYAVVASSEGKIGKNTIVNVNIGAQIFRMYEKSLSAGLLN